MKILRIVVFIFSIASVFNISAQTVYTTKTGEKYHKSSCKSLKYSKKEITLKKAKLLGYSACSVCKPTNKNTQAKTSPSKSSLSNTQTQKTTAKQCTGKTKSGTRCKRKTKNVNGRCYQH